MGSYQVGMGLQGFVQGATDFAKIFMGLLQLQQEQEYKDKMFGLENDKLSMLKNEALRKQEAREIASKFIQAYLAQKLNGGVSSESSNPPDTVITPQNQTPQPDIKYNSDLLTFIKNSNPTSLFNPFKTQEVNQTSDNVDAYMLNKLFNKDVNNFDTSLIPGINAPIPKGVNNISEAAAPNNQPDTKTNLNNSGIYNYFVEAFAKDPETINNLANAFAILNPKDELAEKFKYDVLKMQLEHSLKDSNKFEQIITGDGGKLYGVTHNPKTNEINVVPLQIKDGKYMLDLKKENQKSPIDNINNLSKVSEVLSRNISTAANTLSTLYKGKMSDDWFEKIAKMQSNPNLLMADDVKSLYEQILKLPDTDPNKQKAISIVKSIFSNFNYLSQINNQLLKYAGIRPDNFFDSVKGANPTDNPTNFYNKLLEPQPKKEPKKR